MAYLPHLRATFKGEFRASPTAEAYEQWNTSVALRYGGSLSTASGQERANDLRADWIKFWESMSLYVSTNTFLTEVRLDQVGADGKIVADPIFAQGPTYGGGGMVPKQPPSCAVVLTLDTLTRGRSRFGRMFLPITSVPLGTDGAMSASDQGSILTACKTFIQDVSNAPGIDAGSEVVVASGVGGGSLNTVRSVRVGRVIDTMRSRRRSMDESYKSASVST